MGLNKFEDEIKIPKKEYKSKVDNAIENKFEDKKENKGINLFDAISEPKKDKKVAMSIYFKEEDLKLLKAISKVNNITVNKTIMTILEDTIDTTRVNLPVDFNIEKLAKDYDKSSKNKKIKK